VNTGLHQEPGIAAAAELLASRGAAGIPHPGGTLLAHLERVHALLAQWGARPALRRAGLCHAFYGTDGFAVALGDPSRRDELASMVGEEAERLVYLYASCDRGFSYPPSRRARRTVQRSLHRRRALPAAIAKAGLRGAQRGQRTGYRSDQPGSPLPGWTGPAPPVHFLEAPAQRARLAVSAHNPVLPGRRLAPIYPAGVPRAFDMHRELRMTAPSAMHAYADNRRDPHAQSCR
jgi:hypothetical protein